MVAFLWPSRPTTFPTNPSHRLRRSYMIPVNRTPQSRSRVLSSAFHSLPSRRILPNLPIGSPPSFNSYDPPDEDIIDNMSVKRLVRLMYDGKMAKNTVMRILTEKLCDRDSDVDIIKDVLEAVQSFQCLVNVSIDDVHSPHVAPPASAPSEVAAGIICHAHVWW